MGLVEDGKADFEDVVEWDNLKVSNENAFQKKNSLLPH